jgi:hypothetical protein
MDYSIEHAKERFVSIETIKDYIDFSSFIPSLPDNNIISFIDKGLVAYTYAYQNIEEFSFDDNSIYNLRRNCLSMGLCGFVKKFDNTILNKLISVYTYYNKLLFNNYKGSEMFLTFTPESLRTIFRINFENYSPIWLKDDSFISDNSINRLYDLLLYSFKARILFLELIKEDIQIYVNNCKMNML